MACIDLEDLDFPKTIILPKEGIAYESVQGLNGKRYNNVILYDHAELKVVFTIYKYGWDVNNHKSRSALFTISYPV